MADGLKYVRFYEHHNKKPLFVGTETECMRYICAHATDYVVKIGGGLLIREIEDPDGHAFDVGQAYMYQIVDAPADGSIEIGIDQAYQLADGSKFTPQQADGKFYNSLYKRIEK